MWAKPWKYKEGLVIGAGLIITGVLLQMAVGRVDWDVFHSPVNYIALAAFLSLIAAAHALRKKIYLFAWLGSIPSAVCSIALSSLLTVMMGLIRQRPSESPEGFFPWMDQMLSNWSFVLIYLWMTFSLGLTLLRVCIPFKASRMPFLLNHLGLFIVLTCGVMGSADLQILRMTAYIGTPERKAIDSHGKIHELPIAIELKSFRVDEYPPELMLLDNNDGTALPQSSPQHIHLEGGITKGMLDRWKIDVLQMFNEAAPVFDADTVNYNEFHSSGACPAVLVKASLGDSVTVTGWVSRGSYSFPAKTLRLDEQASLAMPEMEPRRFVSAVNICTEKGTSRQDSVLVNHPCRIEGWKIYQYGYDNIMGRWSEYSIFEIVRDPWMPVVYIGILMLLAGAVLLFINHI